MSPLSAPRGGRGEGTQGVTYEGAGADLDGGGTLADRAVGSRDDGVGVEQDTAAEVRAALGQADDEGEVAGGGGGATHDARRRRELGLILADLQAKGLGLAEGLGDCRGHGEDGHRQSEREGEEGRHRGGLEGCRRWELWLERGCWSCGCWIILLGWRRRRRCLFILEAVDMSLSLSLSLSVCVCVCVCLTLSGSKDHGPYGHELRLSYSVSEGPPSTTCLLSDGPPRAKSSLSIRQIKRCPILACRPCE